MRWNRLTEALDFYARRGYTYVNAPWVVSSSASGVTRPKDGFDLVVNPTNGDPAWGVLVASAEQSFIEMLWNRELQRGKYVALTPCFRIERERTDAIRPWFAKVELINVGVATEDSVKEMLYDAADFMDSYCNDSTVMVVTPDGYDLFLHNYEVGSYGVRTDELWEWTYGTGLAEPRFQVALNAAP